MNEKVTIEQEVRDALEEARILECARDEYDINNIIKTAVRLSGASEKMVDRLSVEMFV